MFTLILTLTTLAGTIVEVDLQTAAPSYNSCMADMPSMAKYRGDHPDKTIVKWHCEDVNKKKTSI